MINSSFSAHTLKALSWPLLLEHIAHKCRSALGKEAVLSFNPAISGAERGRRRQIIGELFELKNRLLALPPLAEFSDVSTALDLLKRGAVLDVESLRAISQIAYISTALAEWRDDLPENFPAIKESLIELKSMRSLYAAIGAVIAADGTIKESASPDLARLKGRQREASRGVEHTLDEMVYNLNQKGLLSDTFYTIRSGRYVLPVKSEMRSQVGGILHDLSNTKKTAYIEPEAVVQYGNQLVALAGEIKEEEERLLSMLSQEAAHYGAAIARALTLAAALDALLAAANYFAQYECSFMEIVPKETPIYLRRIRHPLLLDKGIKVVANDLKLTSEQKALMVTGPNAGGKSVLLKSFGLAALCQAAGLPYTVADGSKMPLFADAQVSIGDEQDIATGQSTFSAHISSLKSALEQLAGPDAQTLVLLDELLADTEPVQGAALARAIIEAFIARGALVLVTTHYTTLKMVAEEDKRFFNIAMGFDQENGRPTYQLFMGGSGSSNPLAVAAAVGVDSRIIERARELAGPEHGQLEVVLSRLNQRDVRLSELTKETNALKDKLMDERARLAEKSRELESERAHLEKLVRAELGKEIAEVKEKISRTIAALQDETGTPKEKMRRVQKARMDLMLLQNGQQKEEEELPENYIFKVGEKVLVNNMGQVPFIIESIDERKGEAALRKDSLRANYALKRLRPYKAAPKGQAKSAKDDHVKFSIPKITRAERAGMRLDLRGLRVDDALSECEHFLDSHYDDGLNEVVIVHGHGTGAVKEAIRSALKISPYVSSFRSGESAEGGDGVTVVTLR